MTRRGKSPKLDPKQCDHCEAVKDEEELDLEKTFGPLMCPKCERNGCFECMPSGRGCICPECEEEEEAAV